MSNEKAPIPEDLREIYSACLGVQGIGLAIPHAADRAIELIERIAALTAEVAALKAQVARLSAPVTEELYDDGRCQICGWPLSKIMEDGCVPESCSMRAREGSEDWFRLKKRREWLAARATPPQDVEKGVKQ